MHVVWGRGTIVVTGILAGAAPAPTLRGWSLIPPDQFGGLRNFRASPLDLDRASVRRVLHREDTGATYLRYSTTADVLFELELLREPAFATGAALRRYA